MKPALLILDDDPNMRAALTRVFRRERHRLLCAASTLQALHLLATESVGVVLCEPRAADAAAFLTQLREGYPLTQRLVLTGYTALQSVADAINLGAVHRFFVKPWDDDELRREVRLAFERYTAASEASSTFQILQGVKSLTEGRVAERLFDSAFTGPATQYSESTLAVLPIGVMIISGDGRIAYANAKAHQILRGVLPLPSTVQEAVAACVINGMSSTGVVAWGDTLVRFRCRHIGGDADSRTAIILLPHARSDNTMPGLD